MVEFYDPIEKEKVFYHLNERLKKTLDGLNERRKKKDQDQLWVIDGAEGSGKSVLTLQLAKYINPNFSLRNVCFSAEEFRDTIQKANKGEVIVFDEAFLGLSSRSALSRLNRMLVSLMMQMRQKNLFVFIVLPSIFLLDKYVSMFRSKVLLHVYVLKNQKRMWVLFNRRLKKDLLLNGAKTMSYATTIRKNRIGFKGNFYNIYSINENEYRKKKLKAFENYDRVEEDDSMIQRNKVIWILNKEFNLNPYKISDLFKKYNFSLSRSSVQAIISKINKELEEKIQNKSQ